MLYTYAYSHTLPYNIIHYHTSVYEVYVQVDDYVCTSTTTMFVSTAHAYTTTPPYLYLMYLTGFPSILHTPRVETVKEICVLVHYIRAADRHAALLASYGRYCTVCMYVCAKNDKRNMYVGEYLSIHFFKII